MYTFFYSFPINEPLKLNICKVEKILIGSLDSIPSPSPSVKIQLMGGKVCLRCKGKTLLGFVNKLLKAKCLLRLPSNILPYYLNFPTDNLNFHWRWSWWDWIQSIFLNLFYFSMLQFGWVHKWLAKCCCFWKWCSDSFDRFQRLAIKNAKTNFFDADHHFEQHKIKF